MRVCFVMPYAYNLLAKIPGIHGGAELQMVRLARLFVSRVQEVWFVTAEIGSAREGIEDGIRVLPAFNPRRGFPGFRFFKTWRDIERALDRADTDIYIQRAAAPLTGLIARYARTRGKLFVYMISNDSNLNGRYESDSSWRDRWLYLRGLKEAHGIVAQSDHQARLLFERHGRRAFVLPSAVASLPEPPPPARPERVLWAGSFQPHKRPHLLLDLARAAPELRFAVAGSATNRPDYGADFERRAATLPNVDLLGRLPRDRMAAEYNRAIALLCTSEYEGFPNTFLEAWQHGVPVVSLETDPDEIICRFELGRHAKDLNKIVAALREFRDDPAQRARIQRAARDYMRRHDENRVADAFVEWLGGLRERQVLPAGSGTESRTTLATRRAG